VKVMAMKLGKRGRRPLAYQPIRTILFFIPALIMLLAASVGALPAGSQSWTEEPWTGAVTVPQETRETTLSDPITTNLNVSGSCSLCGISAASELWIAKGEVWSRYDQVTAGEDVELIVHTPQDGSCDLYLISYANSTIAHWNFKFLADYYYRLTLVPEEAGRLFLLLAQGSEPGNALILDVSPRQIEPPSSASNLNVEDIQIGEALITVKSERIRGYDVYVDGVFFSSDMSDGSLDGCASFTVGGEKTHTITVSQRDGLGNIINKSEHTKSFQRDYAYTLWIG
jgi:hypothetical protein